MNMLGNRFSNGIFQIGFILILLLIWHWVSLQDQVPELLLPKMDAVWERLRTIVADSKSYQHLGITLMEVFLSMSISILAGMILGFIMGQSKYIGDLLDPIVVSLYAIPIIMIYPLCILFFGVGPLSKMVFGGVYAFFPIVLQTMKGVRQVDEQLIKAAVSMGASRWMTITKVLIPAALPQIFTGLRLAIVLGLLAIVAGEMIASIGGVGYQLSTARGTLDSTGLYAWIIVTVLLVGIVSTTLSWLEQRAQKHI